MYFLAIDFEPLYLVGLVLFFALKVETKPSAETLSEPPVSLWNGVKVVKRLLGENYYLAPIFYIALIFNIVLAPKACILPELPNNVFHDLKLLGLCNTLFVSGFLLGSLFYRVVDVRLKTHEYIIWALVFGAV